MTGFVPVISIARAQPSGALGAEVPIVAMEVCALIIEIAGTSRTSLAMTPRRAAGNFGSHVHIFSTRP
jgi:hypothetical protein